MFEPLLKGMLVVNLKKIGQYSYDHQPADAYVYRVHMYWKALNKYSVGQDRCTILGLGSKSYQDGDLSSPIYLFTYITISLLRL